MFKVIVRDKSRQDKQNLLQFGLNLHKPKQNCSKRNICSNLLRRFPGNLLFSLEPLFVRLGYDELVECSTILGNVAFLTNCDTLLVDNVGKKGQPAKKANRQKRPTGKKGQPAKKANRQKRPTGR
jgi:hypothetical protein